jgi:hypothetical protein
LDHVVSRGRGVVADRTSVGRPRLLQPASSVGGHPPGHLSRARRALRNAEVYGVAIENSSTFGRSGPASSGSKMGRCRRQPCPRAMCNTCAS